MDNKIEEQIIKFTEWLTSKDSKFAVMYGEKKRFATNKKDYTIKQVYKIYKNENNK